MARAREKAPAGGDAPVWEQRFERALENAERFFLKEGKVHQAALALAERLSKENVPYAIAGAMALGAHGYERMTTDVDLLVTREGLTRFKAANLGRGYVEKFPGSKGLRDTENGVTIDVLLTGDFPGDGRPKPVAFPDPADPVATVQGERFRIVALPKLIELKLASGMTAPHRLKDLADVLELIRASRLPAELSDELDPFVRQKYLELWQAAQATEPE
ncbi:MAG TPA: hypothetical protein VKQ32_24230 [Polyangia bacterium]|nr:hypothetical protein [Polyangia bacterium]